MSQHDVDTGRACPASDETMTSAVACSRVSATRHTKHNDFPDGAHYKQTVTVTLYDQYGYGSVH